MTSEDSDPSSLLDDVMELSVIELYILNYLIRIAGSVVRFSAYKDINDQLQTSKGISRSSFYHSLEKLDSKGFVKIHNKDSGRTSTVEALPKAKEAITEVNIFNIWGSVDPDTKFAKFLERHNHKIAGTPEQLQLLFSLQYPANEDIIEQLSAQYGTTELLGDRDVVGPLAENYSLVSVDTEGIAHRANRYDQVVIYRYAYNQLRLPFDFAMLVKETLRVTKPGGRIVFLALDDIRSTNNLILESGIGIVLEETLTSQSTTRLLDLLEEEGYHRQEIEHITENGLSCIIVQVE